MTILSESNVKIEMKTNSDEMKLAMLGYSKPYVAWVINGKPIWKSVSHRMYLEDVIEYSYEACVRTAIAVGKIYLYSKIFDKVNLN